MKSDHRPGMGYSLKCVAPGCKDPEKIHKVCSIIDQGGNIHDNGIALCTHTINYDKCLLRDDNVEGVICRDCVFDCECRTDKDNCENWVCCKEVLNKCEDCGNSTCDELFSIWSSCGHSCHKEGEIFVSEYEKYPLPKIEKSVNDKKCLYGCCPRK